jgi:hypothetical protein
LVVAVVVSSPEVAEMEGEEVVVAEEEVVAEVVVAQDSR